MTTEQILNLQYRKILTRKQDIRNLIMQAIKLNVEIIELNEIDILGLLLIEFDNNHKEELSDDENIIIKPFLEILIDNDHQKRKYNVEKLKKIMEIGNSKKIDLDLNKLIAIKYAEYINIIDPVMLIGIEVINNLY